jgi:hypothetical protein
MSVIWYGYHDFAQSFETNIPMLHRIGHERFLANSFQFIISELLRHWTRRKIKHTEKNISVKKSKGSLVSIKIEEFIDQFSDHQLLKISVPLSRLDMSLVIGVYGVRKTSFFSPSFQWMLFSLHGVQERTECFSSLSFFSDVGTLA